MTHSVLFRRSDCHMGCFKSAWRAVLSSTLLHAGLLHQATISRFYVVLQRVNADYRPAVPHLHHRMAAGTHTRPQPAPPLWTQSEHQLTVWSQVFPHQNRRDGNNSVRVWCDVLTCARRTARITRQITTLHRPRYAADDLLLCIVSTVCRHSSVVVVLYISCQLLQVASKPSGCGSHTSRNATALSRHLGATVAQQAWREQAVVYSLFQNILILIWESWRRWIASSLVKHTVRLYSVCVNCTRCPCWKCYQGNH